MSKIARRLSLVAATGAVSALAFIHPQPAKALSVPLLDVQPTCITVPVLVHADVDPTVAIAVDGTVQTSARAQGDATANVRETASVCASASTGASVVVRGVENVDDTVDVALRAQAVVPATVHVTVSLNGVVSATVSADVNLDVLAHASIDVTV